MNYATVDAHGMFYKYPRGIVLSICSYGQKEEGKFQGGLYKLIGVGSALLVLLQWAMRELEAWDG